MECYLARSDEILVEDKELETFFAMSDRCGTFRQCFGEERVKRKSSFVCQCETSNIVYLFGAGPSKPQSTPTGADDHMRADSTHNTAGKDF